MRIVNNPDIGVVHNIAVNFIAEVLGYNIPQNRWVQNCDQDACRRGFFTVLSKYMKSKAKRTHFTTSAALYQIDIDADGELEGLGLPDKYDWDDDDDATGFDYNDANFAAMMTLLEWFSEHLRAEHLHAPRNSICNYMVAMAKRSCIYRSSR